MSYDGMFTHAMIHELTEELANGRVSKVQQPYKNELILTIRSNRKSKKLLLSAHPQYARVHLTEMAYENPTNAPQFCMVLRKYIEGAHLEKIEQIENDRLIHFHFTHRNELGDLDHVLLIAEIMGRHSNILLVDPEKNRILEVIRHVPSTMNTYRALVPGAPYIAPPAQDNINPFQMEELSADQMAALSGTDFERKDIQKMFQGIGRDTADEIVYMMQDKNITLKEAFTLFIKELNDDQALPTLTTQGRKDFFTPIPFESLEGTQEHFDRLSSLVDRYFDSKSEKDWANQQSQDLNRLVSNLLAKDLTKLKKLNAELDETKEKEQFRIKGELLTAYMHEVQQGEEEVSLPNFYEDNEMLTITIDPRKAPAQNAQQYFKTYNKLKSAEIHLAKQIRQTKDEVNYIESVKTQLDVAAPKDIEMIREELIQEGYLRKNKKKKQSSKSKKSVPDQYLSSDGTEILVGKNNLQNDQLTMKTARKTDWWLHTKDIPGSHVIIRDADPSEQTLLEAGHLAAYFSKSRDSASVPVDIVEVKKIKKPNGAKPGFVIYEGQTTSFITPEKDIVRQLKENYQSKQ